MTTRIAAVLVVVALITGAAAALAAASTPGLGQLHDQLSREQARQQGLSSSIGGLSSSIATLTRQIAIVQSREAQVRADLATDESRLAGTRVALGKERRLLVLLRARLARARGLLSRQLVSGYETDHPDLVDVVLEAHGFNDLLEQLTYLRDAQSQQQGVITATRQAKARADGAARRLGRLERTQKAIATATRLRVRALAGMNLLLQSKQGALNRARAAQQVALSASQARANGLKAQISQAEAAQAAARAAAAAAAARAAAQSAPTPTPTSTGPALGPSGGWAIPYAIVLCESGGQNLPPNTAGASGYYQIMPATWKLFGGTGPAAWMASKSEQDAVASRIWNGGAGASNWVCAGIVGIH
jgi:septal ring factor EnvC (AmiA/AmiB activator)